MTGGQEAPPFHLVLLAGGRGTRFWPASRAARPKQFLAFGGGESLLRRTYSRFHDRSQAGSPGATLVVAPAAYHPLIRRDLPELPTEDLLDEPSARETAAAVGLACLRVRRRDPKGLVVVSPTDHVVRDEPAFRAALERALERAREGGLGTMGVKPDRASTEYGYLETDGPVESRRPVPVVRFVEKPDREAAQRYLASGRHLWNAGLFVFRADVFFDEAARVAPALLLGLEAFDRAREAGDAPAARAAWDSIPKLSFDYAVMERAGGVWTVPLEAGWDDLGGWEAIGRLQARDQEGNARAHAEGLFVDSRDCLVIGSPAGADARVPLTVLAGVEGITVVQAGDVTLVCRTDKAAAVRQAVEGLSKLDREDLL